MKPFFLVMMIIVMGKQIAFGAVMGPGGTGGGNGYGSTPVQIEKSLSDAQSLLFYFLTMNDYMKGSLLDPAMAPDSDVRAVLEAWLKGGNQSDVKVDLGTSQRNLQAAPCTGDASEGETDASTLLIRNAPICFSSDRLSRFPVWALSPELFALLGHETAHHFGFGEREAQAIQGYLYKYYGAIQVQYSLRMAEDSFAFLIKYADDHKVPDNDDSWAHEIPLKCLRTYKMLGAAEIYYANGSDEFLTARLEVEFACGMDKKPNRNIADLILRKLNQFEKAFLVRIKE